MICVVYDRKRNDLTIDGHACSGESGHDLVCASASILVYTLASAVRNMAAAEHVTAPTLELAEGHGHIYCKPKERFRSAVMLIFDTVCSGFELLAANYPDNIKYEIKEMRT